MSAAGSWKLIIEDDGGNRQTVPIRRDIITIGRKEGNNEGEMEIREIFHADRSPASD